MTWLEGFAEQQRFIHSLRLIIRRASYVTQEALAVGASLEDGPKNGSTLDQKSKRLLVHASGGTWTAARKLL